MKSPEFVVHGTASDEEGESILQTGFETKHGRPTVSGDLIYALEWAQDEKKKDIRSRRDHGIPISSQDRGRIIVIRTPDDLQVDYGTGNTIEIDDERKEISGYPMIYVGGRKQLGMYYTNSSSRDQKRALEEKNIQREPLSLGPESICMSIMPTPELTAVLNELKETIRQLETPDLQQKADELTQIILKTPENTIASNVDVRSTVRQLLDTTLETEVVSRIRGLSRNVKIARGYTIINKGEVVKKSVNPRELLAQLNELCEKSSQAAFTMGKPSLDRYIRQTLPALRRELTEES